MKSSLDPLLADLEAEAMEILREACAECHAPVMMYSVGKDSSVLLRLAEKAFSPAPIPFPLLHIDTGFKFPEMLDFRDKTCAALGVRLIVHTNREAVRSGANPFRLGTSACCALLKTTALLDALRAGGFDAAIGGARRDEERSRAKERVFSVRNPSGNWDPRSQRPEFWNIYNGLHTAGDSIRVFPLSNWTELDIWRYIRAEEIPVASLYLAQPRRVIVRGDSLFPVEHNPPLGLGESVEVVTCRMRTLGCTYCTGAVRSRAGSVDEIIAELERTDCSERQNRLIDHDQDGSMELKKREGYF